MSQFEIFISYETSKALSLAVLAKKIFTGEGRSAYVYECDKILGMLMYKELAERIDAAGYFFYICTEGSDSRWPQQWELNKALYENKSIIGVAFDWAHVPSELRPIIGEPTGREAFPEFCSGAARNLDKRERIRAPIATKARVDENVPYA